jgi:cell division protein FtsZ
VPRPAEPSQRTAPDGSGAGAADGPAPAVSWKESARRRPVVFDEDDDLDVPDFLK